MKIGRRSSKMILDFTPTMISRKNTTEDNAILLRDPRRAIGGPEGYGSSKMIHPCEASLGEEVMTSLKTEGSTPVAGDPRSNMKSTCGSLGLSLHSAFLAPNVGYFVIKPVRLAIDVTVRIFNSRVIRER